MKASEICKKVEGIKYNDLEKWFEDTGYIYRVICYEGEHFVTDCSFNVKRINLTIEYGQVIKAAPG